MSVICEQRWELWVYGYSTFVLKVSNLDVESFDLPIELTVLASTTLNERWNGTYEGSWFLA